MKSIPNRIAILLLSFSVLYPWNAIADPLEISKTEADRARLKSVRDSLLTQRAFLVAQADSLSVRIDSLKFGSEKTASSAELRKGLRGSIDLAGKIETTDLRIEQVLKELRDIRERLRTSYSHLIEELTQRLERTPNDTLIRQLGAYQRARKAIERDPVVHDIGAESEILIRREDGPREIRRKAELIEDRAALLATQASGMDDRLEELETEQRLRTRMRDFAQEIGLFDEHLPEGRALSAAEETGFTPSSPTEGAGLDQPPTFEAERSEGVTGGLIGGLSSIGKEVTRHERTLSPEEFASDDLVLEIQRLQALRKGLQEREQLLLDRAKAFQEHLRQLLEEKD